MAYTTTQKVRQHLVTPFPLQQRVTDQPVCLQGTDYIRFYGGAVDESTVEVKSIQSHCPVRCVITLEAGATLFSSQPVVPGSVVVASDSSLGTVFVENVDYIIGYPEGVITSKAGGAIAADHSLVLWYLPYRRYTCHDDYLLRVDSGQIRRANGGAIADGETVFLDYTPVHACFTDELVDYAVVMANGMIEREVDPERQFETDTGLEAAATFKALEIVCRAAASRELTALGREDSIALAWMKLADSYELKAEQLVKAFRPPFDNPRFPTHY